jgi:hypothetical protein
MKKICENCKHIQKTKENKENEKTYEWLLCTLFYVETKDMPSLDGFGCNFYERNDDAFGDETEEMTY